MEQSKYEFTADWFSRHIPVWNELIDQLKPARILEIGSYEGLSTCYMVERCTQHKPVEVYCVDSWAGGVEHDPATMGAAEHRFDHNIALAQKRARNAAVVHKIKQFSNLALAGLVSTLGPGVFDLVYVDGSHQAPDVLTDAVMGFQLLRIGGLMIFDDYLWSTGPKGRQDPLNMPKPAIDAFLNLFERKMEILIDAPIFQLYAEKTSN